jgi:hypothetical protein
MANKYFSQFQYTYEKDTVSIFGSLTVGASGAVTSFAGGGISSITKEATAGQYSIVLSDHFQRLLMVKAINVDDAVSAWASIAILEDPAALQTDFKADKTFKIQLQDYAAAAVNATSGAVIYFEITLRNTTVGPYDV